MRRSVRWLAIIISSSTLFVTSLTYANIAWNKNNKNPNWKPRLSLIGQAGNQWGVSADFMYPLQSNAHSLLFADLEALGAGADSARAGSIGLGYRHLRSKEDYILGGYAYIDRWRSPNHNEFNQFTLGAEALGNIWDFRGNLYLPFGTREYITDSVPVTGLYYPKGHKMVLDLMNTEEEARKGFDVEAGRLIPNTCNKLRGYVGLYHYGFDSDGPSVTGPRVRAEYRYNKNWTFTASEQWDHVWGNQVLVGARYSLGGVQPQRGCLQDRMMDYVIRNRGVGLVKEREPGLWKSPESFYYANSASTTSPGGGDGTYEHPYLDPNTGVIRAEQDATNENNAYLDTIYIYTGNSSPTTPYNIGSTNIGRIRLVTGSTVDLIYRSQNVIPASGASDPVLDGTFNIFSHDVEMRHVVLQGTYSQALIGIDIEGANNVNIHQVDVGYYTGQNGFDGYQGYTGDSAYAFVDQYGVDYGSSASSGGDGSDGSNGSGAFGIIIDNSTNLAFTDVTVHDITAGSGGNGGAGGQGGNGIGLGCIDDFKAAGNGGGGGFGGDGSKATGISIGNSSQATFNNITITNITGGNGGNGGVGGTPGTPTPGSGDSSGGYGGDGGWGGDAGNSGYAIGLEIYNVSSTTFVNGLSISNINGGNGGVGGSGANGGNGTNAGTAGGNGGDGGFGGWGGSGGQANSAAGIDIEFSDNTVVFNTNVNINNVYGGDAGAGGVAGNGGNGGNSTSGNGGNGGDAGWGGPSGGFAGTAYGVLGGGLNNPSFNNNLTISNITGGTVGNGADGGNAGNGGNSTSGTGGNGGIGGDGGGADTGVDGQAFGIYLGFNSTITLNNVTITNLTGGVGGSGGNGGNGGNAGSGSSWGIDGDGGSAGDSSDGGAVFGLYTNNSTVYALNSSSTLTIANIFSGNINTVPGNGGNAGSANGGANGGYGSIAFGSAEAYGIYMQNNSYIDLSIVNIGAITGANGTVGGNGGSGNGGTNGAGGSGGAGGTVAGIDAENGYLSIDQLTLSGNIIAGNGGNGGIGNNVNFGDGMGEDAGDAYGLRLYGTTVVFGSVTLNAINITAGNGGNGGATNGSGGNGGSAYDITTTGLSGVTDNSIETAGSAGIGNGTGFNGTPGTTYNNY